MLNDKRHVCFHCIDSSDLRGIYRVDVTDSGSTSAFKQVIREGEVLPDGSVVADFSDGDMNNQDDCLLTVEDSQGLDTLQYSSNGGEFHQMAKVFQDLAPSAKLAGSISTTQALSDDGQILFACDYYDQEEAKGEGLFLMPVGQPAQTTLVLGNDQLLPGTTASIKTFGTAELSSGGVYLVQGSAQPTEGQVGDAPLTYLLTGRVGETPQLLAADPALGSNAPLSGSTYICPRMGGGQIGTVLQKDSSKSELWLGQTKLLDSNLDGGGSLSPRGSQILSVLPPVFGPRGLVFFEVFTVDGIELVLYNGGEFTTILARGDKIAGKAVDTIVFGCLPEAVNAQGELATVVEFSDGETVILLGIPV